MVEAFAASWIEILTNAPQHKYDTGRSLCGFVDWNGAWRRHGNHEEVEAFAASWIEILHRRSCFHLLVLSKPLRLRGLKSPGIIYPTRRQLSKPLRLRGLKFIIHGFYNITPGVEAYAASWIEIQQTMEKYKKVLSRSLCGFVDWNIYHTGSVIIVICRGLCGFVDWNKHDQGIGGQAVFVESDATSWIELD